MTTRPSISIRAAAGPLPPAKPGMSGFEYLSTKGSHAKLRHPDGRVAIVQLHRSLARGTISSILRQASLSSVALSSPAQVTADRC